MRGQSGAREGAQCEEVEASQVKSRNTVFREQKRQQTLNRGSRIPRRKVTELRPKIIPKTKKATIDLVQHFIKSVEWGEGDDRQVYIA